MPVLTNIVPLFTQEIVLNLKGVPYTILEGKVSGAWKLFTLYPKGSVVVSLGSLHTYRVNIYLELSSHYNGTLISLCR